MPPKDRNNQRKDALLGMPTGTAFHRLRKRIMFELAVAANRHACFRCGVDINSVEEFSIEHKEPWQQSATPAEAFFDMANIAFSHLGCNVAAAKARPVTHGAYSGRANCKCSECAATLRKYRTAYQRKWARSRRLAAKASA